MSTFVASAEAYKKNTSSAQNLQIWPCMFPLLTQMLHHPLKNMGHELKGNKRSRERNKRERESHIKKLGKI